MGEGFLLEDMVRTASWGNFRKKLQRIWEFLQKAPQVWKTIRDFFKVDSPEQLAKALRDWAKKGKEVFGKLLKQVKKTFPFSLYFVEKGKMPGLTDAIMRIIEANPKLKKALSSINTNIVEPLDRVLEKHIPNLSRPIKAAVFIYIWLNVVEISWDFQGLIRGFTGQVSLGELFGSFPESALGAFLSLFGIGYGLLPVVLIARILWLVAHKYMYWVPGKGLQVDWAKITGERNQRAELVPT